MNKNTKLILFSAFTFLQLIHYPSASLCHAESDIVLTMPPILAAQAQPPAPPLGWWQPKPGTSWQWQLSGTIDTSIDVDKRIMDINYLGTVALTKAILPHFIQKNCGHIVVTTSIVGKVATPLRSSYSASKHALHGFFDSLRAEVYQNNIKVTLVCPGFVKTNVSLNALTGDGTPQNIMDVATNNGLTSEAFVKHMLKAVKNKKQEVYIGGFKEKLGVYTKRFFPKILAIMIRKMAVT